MAPLPPSSTDRFKYTYENAIAAHSVIIRVTDDAPTSVADAIASVLFNTIGAGCSASTVTAVETAGVGVDIFDPVSDSDLLGLDFGSGTAIKEYNATAITFVGRAPGGRRTRMSLFGFKGDLSEFRLTVAESSDVGTMVDALNDAENGLVAINGEKPVWKAYADIKANDHWVDKSR
jgi:hypothetical protein